MKRRKPFDRPARPEAVRLQRRDDNVFRYLYGAEGWLTLKQINRLVFSGDDNNLEYCRKRIVKLLRGHYVFVTRAPAEDEVIVSLDRRGAVRVEGYKGKNARSFRIQTKRDWNNLRHDIIVRAVALQVDRACEALPSVSLEQSIGENQIRSWHDKVRYQAKDGTLKTREIVPDWFFRIGSMPASGNPGRKVFAFPLEVDRAQHRHAIVEENKIRAGKAYLWSDAFRSRFGVRFGRWLYLASGEVRMRNVIETTRRVGSQGQFYFSTFDRALNRPPVEFLTEPLWVTDTSDRPFSLLSTSPS